MGKDSNEFSGGARMLIILYALGIVILGAYPIRRDIWKMKDKAAVALPAFISRYSPVVLESPNRNQHQIMLDPSSVDAQRETARSAARPANSTTASNLPPAKKLDLLSDHDRKELDNLVNSF